MYKLCEDFIGETTQMKQGKKELVDKFELTGSIGGCWSVSKP